MLTPVQPISFEFTADGVSSSLSMDLSLLPVQINFAGFTPSGVISPAVTSTFTGALTGVTAAIAGTVLTLTFTTPPPELDGSSNVIIYTATVLLQYGSEG